MVVSTFNSNIEPTTSLGIDNGFSPGSYIVRNDTRQQLPNVLDCEEKGKGKRIRYPSTKLRGFVTNTIRKVRIYNTNFNRLKYQLQ